MMVSFETTPDHHKIRRRSKHLNRFPQTIFQGYHTSETPGGYCAEQGQIQNESKYRQKLTAHLFLELYSLAAVRITVK